MPPFPSSGARGSVLSERLGRGAEAGAGEPGARCPRCGQGDLIDALVGLGPGPGLWAFYCAGVYDRDRRRLVQRSCGYLGAGAVRSGV